MLAREREVIITEADFFKDGAKVVETFKGFFHAKEGMGVVCVTASNIGEVEESRDTLDHFIWYIADDGGYKDLQLPVRLNTYCDIMQRIEPS